MIHFLLKGAIFSAYFFRVATPRTVGGWGGDFSPIGHPWTIGFWTNGSSMATEQQQQNPRQNAIRSKDKEEDVTMATTAPGSTAATLHTMSPR